MKSTIQEHQKNIYSSVSKKLILGLALVVFSQSNATTFRTAANDQGDSFTEAVTEKKFAPVEDRTIVNPATLLKSNDQTQMEEVIAQDNKIIDSAPVNDGSLIYIEQSVEDIIATDNKITEAGNLSEILPLYLEPTVEDRILEDNSIIEGNVEEVQPLDFETINKKQMIIKKADNNLLIGMN
jgi:hypothetical protein